MWNKAEVGAVNSIILKRRNPPIVPHDGVEGLCNTVAKRQFSSFKCIRDKLVFLSRLRFFRVALLLQMGSNLKSRKRTYGWLYLVFISFKLRFFIRALFNLLLLKMNTIMLKKITTVPQHRICQHQIHVGHLQWVHRSFSFARLRLLRMKIFSGSIFKRVTFGLAAAAEVNDHSEERHNNGHNVDCPEPRSSFGCFDEGREDVAVLFLSESPGLFKFYKNKL